MSALSGTAPRGVALALALLVGGDAALAQLRDQDRAATAAPAQLIDIVKRHVWPDIDLVTRLDAQRRLQQIGRRSPAAVVPLLVRELTAPRRYDERASHQRLALIETLRDIGPAAEDAVAVLIEILDDPQERNDWVKMTARMALEQIGGPLAEPALQRDAAARADAYTTSASAAQRRRTARHSAFLIRQQLRKPQPDNQVIAAGLAVLRASGESASAALPTLVRAYRDPRIVAAVRSELAATMAALGAAAIDATAAAPEAFDPFRDLLADVASSDGFISAMAMQELGRLGPSEDAINALILALDQGRSPGAAANALGGYGAAAAAAVPHLARHFGDDDAGASAIQAIGKIGLADPVAVGALRRIVRDPGHAYRGLAATTLSLLAVRDALADIQTVLTDERKYTRILAAAAIGRFGADAAPAVAALGRRLHESDRDLRRTVIETLGRIGPAARPLAPLIARDLEAADARLQRAAEQALASIGGAAAERADRARAAAQLAGDRVAAQNLIAGGDYTGLHRLLRSLPERRSLALTDVLDTHPVADVASIAAAVRVERAGDERAVARLIAIALARADGPALLRGVAQAVADSGERERARETLNRLRQALAARLETAAPQVRERFRGLLRVCPEPN